MSGIADLSPHNVPSPKVQPSKFNKKRQKDEELSISDTSPALKGLQLAAIDSSSNKKFLNSFGECSPMTPSKT